MTCTLYEGTCIDCPLKYKVIGQCFTAHRGKHPFDNHSSTQPWGSRGGPDTLIQIGTGILNRALAQALRELRREETQAHVEE